MSSFDRVPVYGELATLKNPPHSLEAEQAVAAAVAKQAQDDGVATV